MKILTISEIWKDFEEALDLNFVKDSERVSNGVKYSDFYFNGYKKSDSDMARGHGIFATESNSNIKKPTIVLVHGIYDSYIQKNWIQHIVDLGFNALWIDLFSTAGIGTTYPDILKHCEKNNCEKYLNHVYKDVVDSPWIVWTSIIRRGIKASLNYSEVDKDKIAVIGGFDSSNIAWQLLAMEDSISCGALLLSSSFYDLKETGKYEEGSKGLTDSDQMYLAAIASEAYASRVNKPVYLQAVTNSKDCDIDRNYDLLARTQSDTNIFIDANAVSLPHGEAVERIKKYFNLVFNKEDLPKAPEIIFEKGEKNKLRVVVSLPEGAESPRVFYSSGNSNPYTRAYNPIQLREEGSRLIGDVNVFDDNSLIFAFASAVESDIRVTSSIIKTESDKNAEKSNVVFSQDSDKRIFTAINAGSNFDEAKVESFVKKVEGPKNIKGVVCTKPSSNLATFNIFSSPIKISDNLVFDIYSQESQKIKIAIIKNYCEESETKYITEVELTGGQDWQRVTVKAGDFITDQGKALEGFNEENISLTYFENAYPIIVNKILFI